MLEEIIEPGIERVRSLPEILERLNLASRQVFEPFVGALRDAHQTRLSKFTSVLNSSLQTLRALAEKDQKPLALWSKLGDVIKDLEEWMDDLQYFDEELSSETFWRDWKSRFAKSLDGIPTSLQIKHSQSYLEVNTGDSLRIRVWKYSKGSQNWLKSKSLRIGNNIRKLRRKPPSASRPLKRKVPVHLFMKYFYELPCADFLLLEWQRWLRQCANQLHEMHQQTESIIDELLRLEEPDETTMRAIGEGIMLQLQRVDQRVATVKEGFDNLTEFAVDAESRFQSFLTELNERMQRNWEFSATVILPTRRFNEQKIADGWSKLEKRFNNCKDAWSKHFNGEKEDWQKDLELSQLQVQTTQICLQTFDSIDSKVKNQILPSFAEPHKMISDSLKKFQETSGEGEINLEREILAENRTMIRSLRRELLPSAMDSVIQAEIGKQLANYLSRIRHAINSLSEAHLITSHRDLEGLLPDSKFVDIPLKDLVLEEIFPELARLHQTLADDLQEKLDKIVRDISEIDQIVQFNLEAALELLNQGEAPDTLSEAQEVVIDGLDRAKKRLVDVIEQNTQMAGLCRQTLLSTTLDFESKVRTLADTEKIIELKLRVAKSKTQEEFRDVRKKILDIAKALLPSIFTSVLDLIKKIKSGYSRIRRATGLAPVTADAEETLSKFVSGLRDQIRRLPHVYQRLFQTEPLSDMRFFEGRDEGLERLQIEFNLWQGRQYGVTGVVGEKGSGKTSLLNFACQQIYQGIPVTRIELAGFTISTEESLLCFLKDVFKEETFETIDELESKFIASNSRRVIIVEDLQNLFLRTVDGFEALERFLLFLSRTQEKMYWVVSCTIYSWHYFDKVLDISRFLQRVVFLRGFTPSDIENIILKRHRVSGYRLDFEAPEVAMQSKKFKKLTGDHDRYEFLKDLFFKQLNDLAAGNITVTMMFWLSAINKIEGDTLVISLKPFDASFLNQLPPEELFTLTAMIQHEMLNAKEHAMIFRQDLNQSLLLLKRMVNKGTLYEKSNGYYQINFLLYRAVVRALTQKNLIH